MDDIFKLNTCPACLNFAFECANMGSSYPLAALSLTKPLGIHQSLIHLI